MLDKKSWFVGLRKSILIYGALFIFGCNGKDDNPDVSSITVSFHINRFEQDLFAIDPNNPLQGTEQLKNKYGNFYNLYIYQITSLGTRDSIETAHRIADFIADTNFRQVYSSCESQFSDFTKYKEELKKSFRYYSYYFPGKEIPDIVTMISGFSYPVICDSSILGISLDMYLGSSNPYYSTIEPPLPIYLRSRMRPEYIVNDAMKGWAASDYTFDESTARMIDFMISNGKLLYFLGKVLPDEPDTIKTGYTKTQLDWCYSNEKQIWSFFIENKLLFSIDPNLMNKYVNDGPTTNGFPKESPGNIGQFIGWQIVTSYMKNHPEVSLQELMEQNDLIKIFNESKYKPAI